jgi:cysteine desulfurase/selenocysteine lyase
MTIEKIRSYFPAFRENPNWIYADNAATTQRPLPVLEAMAGYERSGVTNIHRGLYQQAETSTARYEEARKKTAAFIGAGEARTIAFTKGTTESINTVAFGFLKHQLKAGDEVIVSAMEHHANLIPWQQVCKERGAELKVIPVNAGGELEIDSLQKLLSDRARLLAITHISNTLGTINPIREIIDIAHRHHVPVLVDAAQSAALHPLQAEELNADFLAFSAHKMFGPFGLGVLYVHPKHHENIRPFHFGGGAIKNVSFQETEWLDFPARMEAGTQNISGIIGFSAALDFIQGIRSHDFTNYVTSLGDRLREGASQLKGFKIIGTSSRRTGIVSVFHEHVHPHDIASFLASKNIAVRAGHHCTQPLLDALGIPATTRFSFSIYNTPQQVDEILNGLEDVNKFWNV